MRTILRALILLVVVGAGMAHARDDGRYANADRPYATSAVEFG